MCPLCGDGKARDSAHRCLTLNTGSGAWHCWRCEAKGKLVEWHEDRPRQSKRERGRDSLRRAFALETPGGQVSARADTPAIAPVKAPPRSWRANLRSLAPLAGTPGEGYLQGRALPLDACHAAGARFCPSWFGSAAVVFPLRDRAGELVAAQGRYLRPGSGPKARTAGDKKSGLFATHGVWEDVKRGAPIIICEAPLDALSLAACGFPALALCGKDGWPLWLPIRCGFGQVALALDSDEAGDAGSEKLGRALSSLGAKTFRLRPEGAKDWNELLQGIGRDALADWLSVRLLV